MLPLETRMSIQLGQVPHVLRSYQRAQRQGNGEHQAAESASEDNVPAEDRISLSEEARVLQQSSGSPAGEHQIDRGEQKP